MSLLFVTGAGTGIGKTYVTAHLARHLRVRAVKPVISGFDPAAPAGSDSAILLAAMGEALTPANIDAISPWRYAAPLAPNMAARRENRTIDLPAIVDWCAAQSGSVLIEGVGGVMSPVTDAETVLDWIAALRCPALLVGGSYLGAISHTLTALEAARARRISVAAIVVSESADGIDLDETTATLGKFVYGTPIVSVRRSTAAEQVRFDQMSDLRAIARECFAN